MKPICKYILFDAANTLIHKPQVIHNIYLILVKYGFNVTNVELKKQHRLLSEIILFPDVTNQQFYNQFNAELLYALGIIPNDELLAEIFAACTYQPWQAFEDTNILKNINLPMGIVSNFNSTLSNKINDLFGNIFSTLCVSETVGLRKPSIKFYESALSQINTKPNEVLYIGDSIKLDIEPAQKLNINAFLIDRDNLYPHFKNRINSLNELKNLIQL